MQTPFLTYQSHEPVSRSIGNVCGGVPNSTSDIHWLGEALVEPKNPKSTLDIIFEKDPKTY